jgi:hypothetical protein
MSTQSTDSIVSPMTAAVLPADVIPPEVYEAAVKLAVAQHLPQVIAITRDVYGSFSRVWVQGDADEDPEDTNIIFDVTVNCPIEEEFDMNHEWFRRLREIIPRSPRVYLISPDFQP